MTSTYRDDEDIISNAVQSLQGARCPNVALLSRRIGVSESKLRARLHKRPSKLYNTNMPTKLTPEQDNALMVTLDRLEKIGFHARISMLSSIANSLLRQARPYETPPPKVSHMWPSRWMKTHPDYNIVSGKPLAIKRKNSHNPRVISEWFEKYNAVITEYTIHPADISNVDETGFRIGVGRAHKVITKDTSTKIYMPDADVRTYITVVECEQANGGKIPPMVIQQGTVHLERFFPEELEDDVSLGLSSTGYNNDELSMDWLHHYDRYTKDRCHGVYRLLIFDGFGSHLLIDFISYCWDHNIVPLCLPAHATHLMQPLDVVVFQPYRHYHAESLDRVMRQGNDEYNNVDFLAGLKYVRDETFKHSTILSSFYETGLVPYNPQIVLDRLARNRAKEALEEQDDQANDDLTQEEVQWVDQAATPRTIRQFNIAANNLAQLASELDDDIYEPLSRFVKGAHTAAHAGQIATDELEDLRAAMASRKTRQSASTKHVQKGGVIYVKDARIRMKVREVDEYQTAERLLRKRDEREAKVSAKAIKRIAINERKAAVVVVAAEKKAAVAAKRLNAAVKKAEREAVKATKALKTQALNRA